MWGAIASIAGGLLGSRGGGGESSQTRQLDPRLGKYVFGEDDKSGLLGDASRLYGQQIATGGLNDIQRQGLGMQQQYLMSPQYQQGNQGIYNMGMSLLGGGVASNPFTSGRMPMPYGGGMGMPGGMSGGMQRPQMAPPQGMTGMPQPSQGFQYQPIALTPPPDYSAKPPEKPAFTEADFERWLNAYLARQAQVGANHGSGDGFGGGFGGGDSSGSDGSDGPSAEA
jgi:hypothetical protein